MAMKRALLPLVVFLAGIGVTALSVMRGQASIALFLIFPVVYGGGLGLALGILLIFLSFILFFFLPMGRGRWEKVRETKGYREPKKSSESKFGGVVFIGPIPIIFGKDTSMAKKMMYLGLIIAVILVLLYVFIIWRI